MDDGVAAHPARLVVMSLSRRVGVHTRCRSGLSVIEVLVALILVSVGLMGIAGSTALALRTTLESTRRRHAAQRVESRFAQLSAAGCAHAVGGNDSDTPQQLSEQWAVAARVNGFATISDTVTWMTASGTKSFSMSSAIAC